MPALGLKGKPREVTGTRAAASATAATATAGPMARGELTDMGPTAVLDTGKVRDRGDLAPRGAARPRRLPRARHRHREKKRYLMLKSRVHWRAGLRPIAQAVVECAGDGRLHLGLLDC